MPLTLHPQLSLLILFVLIPSSCQRILSSLQQHIKCRSNSTIEIPIVSRGMPSSSQVYLVPIQIGEPSQTLLLVPDTGSDASWFYCGRLPHPHHQNFSGYHIFDHSRSSTFTPIYCSSPSCNAACSTSRDLCNYTHDYVDSTSTTGYWATDTVTVSSDDGLALNVYDVMIGCSSQESTNLEDGDGILGLSPSHPSFANHMAPRFGHIFSYFLWHNERDPNQNLVVFGRTRRSGFDREQMQYTDLVDTDTFFYVEVSKILVNGASLDIPSWVWEFDARRRSGGVILDTGTTFTFVPGVAFRAIHSRYAEFFGSYQNAAAVTSSDICFQTLGLRVADGFRIPEMVIEFKGGARLSSNAENLFYEDGEGIKCMAIREINETDGSIIGIRLQKGYFWEYDLYKQRVGFAPLTQMTESAKPL